jgi:phasin
MNDIPRNPILPDMLKLAEQSVEHAKQAFDDWMTATKRAVSAVEGQTAAVHSNARELQRQALGFAERNVRSSFEFAQRLMQARSPEEAAKLHADFISEQMRVLGDQARELGLRAGKPPTT